jgi:hypothetical protein
MLKKRSKKLDEHQVTADYLMITSDQNGEPEFIRYRNAFVVLKKAMDIYRDDAENFGQTYFLFHMKVFVTGKLKVRAFTEGELDEGIHSG